MASLSLIRFTACPKQLSSKFRQPLPPFLCNPPAVRLIHVPITKISASSTPIPIRDRVISATSYFFPFVNSFQYPILAVLLKQLSPIFYLHYKFPNFFAMSFLALYIGVALNPNFSRYVRFNALHALALDLLMYVPFTLEEILFGPSPDRSVFWLKLTVWGYNALFLLFVVALLHGLICSVLGKTPYWPFVSEAVEKQLK